MRANVPAISCDAEDGLCGAWEADFYEQCTWSVAGIRITATVRAPGWVSTDDTDLCPEHAAGSTP